jgi:hypothetical protein
MVVLASALVSCSSRADDQRNEFNVDENLTTTEVAPQHRYDFKEGRTYGYISAVSEEDQKKGKAAGDVSTFTYQGNEGSVYRLALVDPKGVQLARYECTKPCVAIKAYWANGDVQRIAYNPDSVIGSVYQDAMNGFLEPVREPMKPTPSAWAGEYNGTFEGATGTVTIKDRGDQLAVEIGIGAERCSGGIDFTAPLPAGGMLIKRLPPDDSGNRCTITLTREGRALGIDEDGCSYYHGAECSFNGAVTR